MYTNLHEVARDLIMTYSPLELGSRKQKPRPPYGHGRTFPDGAHVRLEISGVETPNSIGILADEMKDRGVRIHRVIGTVSGMTLRSREELTEYARTAKENGIEVIVTPGPRATWDIGRQVITPEGRLSGLGLRGAEQMKHYLFDVLTAVNLGYRGFLVWDIGALDLLNALREDGKLPKDVKLKYSIFGGCANPYSARVFESHGADSINPVADLTIDQLTEIRAFITHPVDVHVMIFDSFGGVNRIPQTPEIVRACHPCYLKIEPGKSVGDYSAPDEVLSKAIIEKVKYASIIEGLIKESCPEIKISDKGSKDLAVPV